MKMAIHRMQLPMHPLVAPLNNLEINLALVNVMTSFHHAPVTNTDSAKTAPSNGMIAPCKTLPLGCIQQRTLMQCTNLPSHPNCVTLNRPHAVPLPASPPYRERNSHSSYHANDHHCSGKCSQSCSCLRSCSHRCDCHDDDCHSQRSSCLHHSDTFIGHHDFQPTRASLKMEPIDNDLHQR